jgi:salicylate hydroxylase
VASSRNVIIAGAGIGGLTAALAMAQHGFGVTLLDQTQRLEETGAGIQLSPNASRILIALGLERQLRQCIVEPAELRVIDARTAKVQARAPLGRGVEERHGAPYWVIHRGDLQAVLINATRAHADIAMRLGTRVETFVVRPKGVTVSTASPHGAAEEHGMALIGADGLWSSLRQQVGAPSEPRFARHSAWRALIPADQVAPEFRVPAVNLWLGHRAHLVHYPVRQCSLVNVVAIIRDDWHERGWSARGERCELLSRYPAPAWPAHARTLLSAPQAWRKWALFDCAPFAPWGKGPVTLLGDAAHPMLPFLAQGAASAIEDAAVLASRLSEMPDDAESAMRRYEHERRRRTARIQRAARRNGAIYHLGGPATFARTLALLAMGERRMLTRYDWLYGWKPA